MQIEDFLLQEIERAGNVPPSVEKLAKEVVRLYKENLATLAAISSSYVKTYHELAELREKPTP